MTGSLSPSLSSQPRYLPNEQTPLLQEPPKARAHENSKPLDDEEEQDQGEISGLASEGGTTADSKETVGLMGVISVLLLGVFIANADASIVLATYGTISSEIGSLKSASWLVVTGAGQTLWQMVAGRAIGGIGGAGMTSLVSIIIADKVPLRDVATWRSYVNIASTVGRSAGGPIGGYLADTIGWRWWSFYLQSPLAIVAIVLVLWKFDSTEPSLSGRRPDSSKTKLRRVDFFGSVTLAITITSFLLALDLGGQKIHWNHPIIWMLVSSSAVFGLVFLLVEGYVAQEPIFPLRLIVHRDVVVAYLVTGLQTCAQFAVMYTVPLYFQVTARTSVTIAGAHLMPAVCGNAIGGLSLYITPGGFGTGVVMSTTFVYLAAGVEESQMAISSTGLYLSANLGTLMGVSLASSVLQTSLRKVLKHSLKDFADQTNVSSSCSYMILVALHFQEAR
ncbi:hypothetical protein MMC07_008653 [Pseudocyphellaria aurata]|nr:hypothetical protein [Pseudocyphellaria aurata]